MSEHLAPLDDAAFDKAVIAAAFHQAARIGWRNVRVAAAASEAGLSVARARYRFPSRASVLVRFGRLADAAALGEPAEGETLRERLFAMLMRRFDVLQAHRAGILALLSSLPGRPRTALFLALLTGVSMRWILDAAGASTLGVAGRLRIKGLMAVWLWALRAWERDETADLTTTMAALDVALARAERAAAWLARLPGTGAAPATAAAPAGEAGSTEGDEKGAKGQPAAGGAAADEPFHPGGPPPEEPLPT